MSNKNTPIKRVLHTVTKLRVRETNNKSVPSRIITGYAILFNVPSEPLYIYDDEEAREIISPGAVTKKILDQCDIKMTMFHDRQLILARSKNGKGTLSYRVDKNGVYFEFDAPNTADGDKALELVRRGDITGCSFMFSTLYYDENYVKRTTAIVKGKTIVTYTVNTITGIYDFTLAADPAYAGTNCETEARELIKNLRETKGQNTVAKQVKEMRDVAAGGSNSRKINEHPRGCAAQLSEMRDTVNKKINPIF